MKTIAIICTLTFLLCIGIVNGGTFSALPMPTTTTIIIAMPPPTVTVHLTTTTTTISTTTTVPITAPPVIILPSPTTTSTTAPTTIKVPVVTPLPIIIQPPTITVPQQRIQYAGNLTPGSQIYFVNIQNVSLSQALIVSINGIFPAELYLNVSVPINRGGGQNLRAHNFSLWTSNGTTKAIKIKDLTPPTVFVTLIERDGIQILNVNLSVNKTVRQLAIKKFKERLTLESGGIVATTESTLEINESGVYVGAGEEKTELKVLPDEASGIAEDAGIGVIENIELKEVGQKPVYDLKGTKKGKLFGVIPVDMKVELHVNVNTGEVVRKKEPWWSFLVRGEEK